MITEVEMCTHVIHQHCPAAELHVCLTRNGIQTTEGLLQKDVFQEIN